MESIDEYLQRLVDTRGADVLLQLPRLLTTGGIAPPNNGEELDRLLEWIQDVYVPSEPSLLSPGAMSNAPDRLDGFHSFNRCCRGEADTGRHTTNMKTYTTDRRVFEYWSEGNWIAADRMMGIVRARFADHPSADGGEGPPTADHIGPLSLGFTHRPEFRLLSRSANSAKNNRMTHWDVEYLRGREREGAKVVSWYAGPVWESLRDAVTDEETALRLSKVMRDNQRQAISFLGVIRERGFATFLASLLELEYAGFVVDFEDLVIDDFVTKPGALLSRDRKTKYAAEQKARRLRIGFEALRSSVGKANRRFLPIMTPPVFEALRSALDVLGASRDEIRSLDRAILSILDRPATRACEEALRAACAMIPRVDQVEEFGRAKNHLQDAMHGVAAVLAANWSDERYVRAEFALDDD